MTPDPIGSTYEVVVPREGVMIIFNYVEFNSVDICAADIRNAYLWDPYLQKGCIIFGPYFDLANVAKKSLINRDLYFSKAEG